MEGGSASGSTGAAGASAAASAALRDLGALAPSAAESDLGLDVGSGVFVGVMSAGS